MLLISERLERLAAVRSRMMVALAEVRDAPYLARPARQAIEALDVHLAVLQQTLRDVQAGRFGPHHVEKVQVTWQALLQAQGAARTPHAGR